MVASTDGRYDTEWRQAAAAAADTTLALRVVGVCGTMHNHDYSSDNDNMGGNDLPAGVLRSRGGWEDTQNIEMEHQRERLRLAQGADQGAHGGATGRGLSISHAAVDLTQFRNEEVGKGYKAKHVVRQRDASLSMTSVVDMSGGKFSKQPATSTKRNNDDKQNDTRDERKIEPADVRHRTYLEYKGMRDFMKEIDKILQTPGRK